MFNAYQRTKEAHRAFAAGATAWNGLTTRTTELPEAFQELYRKKILPILLQIQFELSMSASKHVGFLDDFDIILSFMHRHMMRNVLYTRHKQEKIASACFYGGLAESIISSNTMTRDNMDSVWTALGMSIVFFSFFDFLIFFF